VQPGSHLFVCAPAWFTRFPSSSQRPDRLRDPSSPLPIATRALSPWEKWPRYEAGHLCLVLTYLLTPWSRVLVDKLTGFQLVKIFPASCGTRRFIIAFTITRRLSLFWATSIQSVPLHLNSWRFILILSSVLRLGLPSHLFPSGFPTKTLYTPLLSPMRATCPAYLILLDFIARKVLGEEYRSLSSSLCSFLHSPVTSSLLGPNILLNTLFSNILSLRSSLSVSD